MSEQWTPHSAWRPDDVDPIARLLKAAGSRPQPDPAKAADFKETLRAEWRLATAARRHHRAWWWAAAAAGIAATVVIGWVRPFSGTPATPQVVGHVARVEGAVHSLPADRRAGAARNLVDGQPIRSGTVLDTGPTGRVAVALGAGLSLRLDRETRVAVVAARIVALERGGVYIDADSSQVGPVVIRTAHGEVRDIGTQFEVRVDGTTTRVKVRDGEVLVNAARSALTARAGEALFVTDRGSFERRAIPRFGSEWAWTSLVAPQFALEGSTVRQFLDWVAREQGWRWRFVDEDTARRAGDIVAHGSIDGYTPEEALDIVLPACGLAYVRDGDEVIVSLLKEKPVARVP